MRRLAHLFTFAVAFLATGAWIRSLDALPFWSHQRGRYQLLHEQLDELDVVFVGSSRMNFAVIPAVFDARMRELGCSARSLNLGISGQRGHDTVATIEHLLRLQPKRIRGLVIELNSFDQRIRGTNWLTDLDVEMHPPGLLLPRLRSALASGDSFRSVVDQVGFLVAHTAANTFRVGQGARLVDDLLAAATARRPFGARSFANRGFEPAEDIAGTPMREAAKRFATDPGWAKQLMRLRTSPAWLEKFTGGFPVDEFLRVDALVREAGILPIYVVMPTYYVGFYGYDALPELARRATVVHLDDPEQHPQLFDPRIWYDPGHFGNAGAAVFTRYLADRVAEQASFRAILAPVAADPLQVRLTWAEGEAARLRCELDGGDVTGAVVLRIDPRTDETLLAEGLRQELPAEVAVTLPLVRDERGRLSGEVDVAKVTAGLPPGALLHVQAVQFVDGKAVAVGPLASLPTPR